MSTAAPTLKELGYVMSDPRTGVLKSVAGDQCYHCHGSLCVSKGALRCSRCGLVQTEHPKQKEIAAAAQAEAAKPKPTAPVEPLPPFDFAATHADRLLAVERQLKAQGERLARLEKAQGERKK